MGKLFFYFALFELLKSSLLSQAVIEARIRYPFSAYVLMGLGGFRIRSHGRPMDEESSCSSWLGRAKFSHTIYHRFNSSSDLAYKPLSIEPGGISRESLRRSLEAPFPSKKLSSSAKSQIQHNPLANKQRSVSPSPQSAALQSDESSLETPFQFPKLAPANPQIQYNPLANKQRSVSPIPQRAAVQSFRTPISSSRSLESSFQFPKLAPTSSQIQYNPLTNRQRSASPLPQTLVPDTFREARAERKRSVTPQAQRKEPHKGIVRRLLHREARESNKHVAHSWTPNSSPARHVAALNLTDKKGRKDSAWTKYFDHAAGKVNAVEAADEHMVDLSQLFLGHRFAYGAHSKLYHGIYKEEAVAVKIITSPDDDENDLLKARLEKQFNREVTSLCRLHHTNVIKFVAACRKPPVFCIVTEYLSEGSLRSYLHKLQNKTLPLKKLVSFALDIARGMEYIHSQGVIHRDLKPENVLINEDFHMKIADFGIACEEVNCDPFADDPGTYRWMAPEMIKDKFYGRKVDVYSFGLILWEMVSGSIPYEDMKPIQAAYAVVNKNLRPQIPKDCHPGMQALIEQCWSTQPDKRPEFWQIVKVLEQFESSLAIDGTLKLVRNITFEDHKKGMNHWIQKLSTTQSSSILKPKFNYG
ncbi:hypothetical protein V2J09_018860 [Rumex salicifolius]